MPRTIIVVPCFNEQERFSPEAFRKFAEQWRDGAFLLVDDGSTDNTLHILKDLEGSMPNSFAVLGLPKNVGKAEAVRSGFQRAFQSAPEYVGFWDADLATPVDAVPLFETVFAGKPATEMVFGARVKLLGRRINRNALRHYLGRVFATAVAVVLGIEIYDSQCGAKLFRNSSSLRAIFNEPFLSKWIFDVEILARFIILKRPLTPIDVADFVYELPLPEWIDKKGSKLRAVDFGRALVELWRIRRTLSSGSDLT